MAATEVNQIRVLTVDDHELIRQGIRFSLIPVEDVDLVGEARDSAEALEMCRVLQPDVVLMDMRLAGDRDGINITHDLRRQFPQTQVIILRTFYSKDIVQGAIQAGAIGYLIKGVSGEELTDAIRTAAAGRPALAAEALAVLTEPMPAVNDIGRDLTERELEVLAFLVAGLSNAQIAGRQHVSVAAIKYHVSNILTKLGVSNRTEAATLALEQGLIKRNSP